jgi:hypothetical protein
VCLRGGKAPTRRNLGAASLISFVMHGPGSRSVAGLFQVQEFRSGTLARPAARVRVTSPRPGRPSQLSRVGSESAAARPGGRPASLPG